MRRLLGLLLLASGGPLPGAVDPAPAAAAVVLEQEVAALVAGPQVTVVHFWAPWCPNCRAELGPEGWGRFIAARPEVQFVFLNVWHKGQDPAPALAAAGLGPAPNLLLRTHPNPARQQAERLTRFLDLPLTWLPTTWVFRNGRLCYALNYGEVRFEVLGRLVEDARDGWTR